MEEMKYITLNRIVINGNRCEYLFDYPSEFEQYIAHKKQKLFIELPAEIDIKSIPEAILAVPFAGSMLSVTMLLGIGIKVPVIDRAFFECLSAIKKVYENMFPYAELAIELIADKITDCKYVGKDTPSLFFTGGLDATSALIDRVDEKPLLINIWGGDLLLTDELGIEALERYISNLTAQIGNDYVIMKSNCRRYFSEPYIEKRLSEIIKPEHNHGWWASIAHILSMTSTIAPILYKNKVRIHYIGSGYPKGSTGFDCNNVDMVNSIKVANCTFRMVDAELDRPEKAKKIIDYCESHNLKVELKVCWFSHASENCSHCEKCYRTISEILINHADPNQYGFKIDKEGYKEMHRFLKYNIVNPVFWERHKNDFLKEYDYWNKNKDMSWILKIDFNNSTRINRYRRLCRVKSMIWNAGHKLIGK